MSNDKDISEVVACVVDNGMFMPVAVKMAEQAKKVYWHKPYDDAWPIMAECVQGNGFSNFHYCEDYWHPDIFKEIDLFIFPNLIGDNLQGHLEQSGKFVWGSRQAARLERMKGLFYKTLEEVGLPVPPYEVISGFTKLDHYLKSTEDVFIKISKYRGTMETWHHANYDQSEPYLSWLRYKFGSFRELIKFYVIDKIDTEIEGGIDTYCIDGQWPNTAVIGYEQKNKTYLACVLPWDELPKEYTMVNEAFGPVLKQYGYKQFFSTEIRHPYLIDPTCRCPSPAGEEQLEVYGNMPVIFWKGAQGELVQPDIVAPYCGESLITYDGEPDVEKKLKVPDEIKQWVKLYGCALVDGYCIWPPDKEMVIGAAVSIGDSPTEVLENLKSIQESLSDQKVIIDLTSFADLIKEVESSEEQGMSFGEQPLPDPVEALPN